MSPAAEVARKPDPTDPSGSRTRSARASTFSSLRIRSYRLYAAGQAFSNIGTWVQRTAQDWLVLGLTGSATSVGLATTLQLGPTVLLGLLGGLIADRYPKRRILLCTQTTMASLAALLSLLALSQHLQVWAVYLVALALGIVVAIDKPAQQSFVAEMVGRRDLRNAVSLNSSLWQLGALTGPAVSGVLMNAVGVGYTFAINAASFVPPVIALWLIRDADLILALVPLQRGHADARHAVLYAVHRPSILWSTVLAGVVGLFTINLPVTLSAYAKDILHSGAGGYALLSTAVAIGSFGGALLSARRPLTRLRSIIATAVALSVTLILAALATGEGAFALTLVLVGAASVIVLASTSSMVQLASDRLMRGRVVGAYLIVFVGSGAFGGPVVGEMDQVLGPRLGTLISGVVLAAATILIGWTLAQTNRLRVQLGRPRAGTRFIGIVSR